MFELKGFVQRDVCDDYGKTSWQNTTAKCQCSFGGISRRRIAFAHCCNKICAELVKTESH